MAKLSILKGQEKITGEDEYLHKVFEAVASKFPNKTAVIDLEEELTFQKLNEVADKVARWIYGLLGCQKLVAVRFEPKVELIVTLLAILKSGNAYVPVAPDWPRSRFDFIIEDAKPSFCITNITEPEFYHDFPIEVFEIGKILAEDPYKIERAEFEPNPQFAVMYTSGSTGLPKGVKLLHKSALFRAQWQWDLLPYQSENDVCAFKVTFAW